MHIVRMIWRTILGALTALYTAGMALAEGQPRPQAREAEAPVTRWTHQPEHALWDRVARSALMGHGRALVEMVPRDIRDWCPEYRSASMPDRRDFWVGFLSALAKHESTYRPGAVGGGGKWYGLLQILPATARGYGCSARSGSALKSGAANLSCAVRIMAVTVPRDGVIYAPGGRGVAADWGPMRSRAKRADMATFTRGLPACALSASPRPVLRPAPAALLRPRTRPLRAAGLGLKAPMGPDLPPDFGIGQQKDVTVVGYKPQPGLGE